MTDSNDGDSENIEVLDPKQYNQNRRLKEIHGAREEVLKLRRKMTQSEDILKKWSEEKRNQEFATAVAEYAMQLEPVMMRTEAGKELLYEDEIGPYDGMSQFIGSLGTVTVVSETENESSAMLSHANQQSDDKEIIRKPVGKQTSYLAFRKCNEFMAQVGLDADIEEQKDPAEI
jgi:hypothetical protein